jgi:hypothetical protein
MLFVVPTLLPSAVSPPHALAANAPETGNTPKKQNETSERTERRIIIGQLYTDTAGCDADRTTPPVRVYAHGKFAIAG